MAWVLRRANLVVERIRDGLNDDHNQDDRRSCIFKHRPLLTNQCIAPHAHAILPGSHVRRCNQRARVAFLPVLARSSLEFTVHRRRLDLTTAQQASWGVGVEPKEPVMSWSLKRVPFSSPIQLPQRSTLGRVGSLIPKSGNGMSGIWSAKGSSKGLVIPVPSTPTIFDGSTTSIAAALASAKYCAATDQSCCIMSAARCTDAGSRTALRFLSTARRELGRSDSPGFAENAAPFDRRRERPGAPSTEPENADASSRVQHATTSASAAARRMPDTFPLSEAIGDEG